MLTSEPNVWVLAIQKVEDIIYGTDIRDLCEDIINENNFFWLFFLDNDRWTIETLK
jgi:hypothetical protein